MRTHQFTYPRLTYTDLGQGFVMSVSEYAYLLIEHHTLELREAHYDIMLTRTTLRLCTSCCTSYKIDHTPLQPRYDGTALQLEYVVYCDDKSTCLSTAVRIFLIHIIYSMYTSSRILYNALHTYNMHTCCLFSTCSVDVNECLHIDTSHIPHREHRHTCHNR